MSLTVAVQNKPESRETAAGEVAPPLVTALVCTRNRGASLVATLTSILASDYPTFEIVVVDQSRDDVTKNATQPFLAKGRVRYIATPDAVGTGRSRNTGIRAAQSDIVVITDDDVEVPPEWIGIMQQIFTDYPRVAVAFCNVDAASHDKDAGFIPMYHRKGELRLTRIRDKNKARGIGAGMAVRRSYVEAMGGFDELLGPGSPGQSGEDFDLTARALYAGYEVYETARVSVLHSGFRRHDEGRAMSRRDWFGIGAAYAKPLKAGHLDFLPIPAYEFFRNALWPPVRNLLQFKKPSSMAGVIYFWKGVVWSWRMPLDKKSLLLIAPKGLPDATTGSEK